MVMDNAKVDLQQEALELLRSGRRREAAALLAQTLKHDPDDERAWHILSYAVAEREQQIYALRRVLQINPDNRAARNQLSKLSITGHEAVPPTAVSATLSSAPPSEPAPPPVAAWKKSRQTTNAKKLLRSPALVSGCLILLILATVALAAPLIAPPVDAEAPEIIPSYGAGPVPQPPSVGHPLGLLPKQYDVFYGLIWGTRRAFEAGLLVTLTRVLFGVLLGLISGHYGGWLDAILMRFTDAFLSFPLMAAAMVMVALYGVEFYINPSGIWYLMPARQESIVMYALVIFGWMPYTRLIRGNVLAEREKEYMQAARSTGTKRPRTILRHLLPNVLQGLFVLAASDVGAVVVLLAAFAFIGLFSPSFGLMEADWGQMLSAARDWIVGSPTNVLNYWYTYLPVSAAIVLFSLGWNLVGDGLRDVVDPKMR
jgi:peptide/nickel transport system permease protein